MFVSASDRGPEANFFWKFSELIRGRTGFVGLFPGVATLRMIIVLGQCPLSWSEGPIYPQEQTLPEGSRNDRL